MRNKGFILILCAALGLWKAVSGEVSVSEAARNRIVSLAPSLTEEIYLLGAEDDLVANTAYCVSPEAARYKDKVGSVTNVNTEKIVALKPNIVLATSLTNLKTVRKLKDLGIDVRNFPAPKNFNSLCAQFLELGAAVGKGEEAKAIIAGARKKVDAVKARTAGLSRPRVFIQIGAKPLFTANADYIVSDFVELAGGMNIARDADVGTYSREDVIKNNADVIIIVTMGIAAEKEKESWQKFGSLNAVRNNRIYVMDSPRICGPTPATFAETLEEVVMLLHPELSKKEI